MCYREKECLIRVILRHMLEERFISLDTKVDVIVFSFFCCLHCELLSKK
jgi:hypothetical protein